MNIPIFSLVAFALWTILLLAFTIGVFRWSKIIQGEVPHPSSFRADNLDQWGDFYRRAMRAHMNCVENLPVFGALIFGVYVLQIQSELINTLCIIFLIARICQSLIHVSFIETRRTVGLRFLFFFVQIIIDIWLGIEILINIFK